MIKTKYTASDYIPYIESQKGDQFKNKIRNEYVYGNPLYSAGWRRRSGSFIPRPFLTAPGAVPLPWAQARAGFSGAFGRSTAAEAADTNGRPEAFFPDRSGAEARKASDLRDHDSFLLHRPCILSGAGEPQRYTICGMSAYGQTGRCTAPCP